MEYVEIYVLLSERILSFISVSTNTIKETFTQGVYIKVYLRLLFVKVFTK